MGKRGVLALAFALVSLTTMSGCGSSSGSSKASPTTTTTITVKYSTTRSTRPPRGAIEEVLHFPSFSQPSVTVHEGTVVFYLVNAESPRAPGQTQHNMVVVPSGSIDPIAVSDRVDAGQPAIFTIEDLPAGSYTFHCSVERHAEDGMKGNLTVTA